MARTLDQIVQDTLGAQLMTIVQLQAQLDSALARIAELEAQHGKPAPNGPQAG